MNTHNIFFLKRIGEDCPIINTKYSSWTILLYLFIAIDITDIKSAFLKTEK